MRCRRAGLVSGLLMKCWVDEVTFVTTEEIAETWVLIVVKSRSARMLSMRVWID